MGVEGSSESSSSRGSGAAGTVSTGVDPTVLVGGPCNDGWLVAAVEIGFGRTSSSNTCGFGGGGVSSIVECLPVVQGGIDRNSSKVRTRGLQHFQPIHSAISLRPSWVFSFFTHLSVLRETPGVQGDIYNLLLNR